MPAATAISTCVEMPPPFEVSAETMKAVMMLIAGSAVSSRTRSEIAECPVSRRGVTTWLMSTSTGRMPDSTRR